MQCKDSHIYGEYTAIYHVPKLYNIHHTTFQIGIYNGVLQYMYTMCIYTTDVATCTFEFSLCIVEGCTAVKVL